MKKLIIGLLLIILCMPALAKDKKVPRAHVDKDYYSVVQYLVKRAKSENPIAVLRFEPTEGWKWNKKYPARFTIEDKNKSLSVLRWHTEYIETDQHPNAIEIWLELKSAVTQPNRFTIQGKYSFCNSTSCAVFKREIAF